MYSPLNRINTSEATWFSYRSGARRVFLPAALLLALSGAAYADVYGRLKLSVKNADDEKAISGAKIVLKDSAGVHAPVTLTTDASGTVTTPLLEARSWSIEIDADAFQPDKRQVNVVADVTTDVEVLIEPLKEKVIKIKSAKDIVKKSDTSNSSRRDTTFVKKFPTTGGNPQSLSTLLRSNPGFAQNSNNQVHPRGEHASTTIYINGFQLPGALQGRAGQILTPSAMQSVDVLTGGYAPEYGSETAAILNVNLKSGSIKPFHEASLGGGTFGDLLGSLTFGGQTGQRIGEADENGLAPRRFGYLVDVNLRRTDNGLEPPQPDRQTAHNRLESASIFGNFDYQMGGNDHLSLTLNTTPARSQVANRTGLSAKFAPVGQGYGFLGLQGPGAGILSQEDAGQDDNQKDTNAFGVLNWRHTFNDRMSSMLSIGLIHSGQDLTNNNPLVDTSRFELGNAAFDPNGDGAIEYNPTLIRNSHNMQVQGSLSILQGGHNFKLGFNLDEQNGQESYNFIPGSQLALNLLAATDPRLVGPGTFLTDAGGNPILDSQGNQVYALDPGATFPTLSVSRKGYYHAAYVQDTWRMNSRATLNYGLRYDIYHQTQNLGQPGLTKNQLSPRVNLAYLMNGGIVGRASYNKLFIQPPIAQGAILGDPIQPETLDQYELSFEKQVGANQKLKLTGYYKDIRHQLDTGLLIGGTQIGAYTAVNIDRGAVRGYEFSYELAPPGSGWGAYVAFAHSTAKPGGFDNTGGAAEAFNDHDQLNTLSAGLNYGFRDGASAGLNLYYGSGLASSDVFGNGQRSSTTLVNLRYVSTPRLFNGLGSLQLDIENLFDERKVLAFNSAFSGTRFQQGRRLVASLNVKF